MKDEAPRNIPDKIEPDRRQILQRLLALGAFSVPAVRSFALGPVKHPFGHVPGIALQVGTTTGAPTTTTSPPTTTTVPPTTTTTTTTPPPFDQEFFLKFFFSDGGSGRNS